MGPFVDARPRAWKGCCCDDEVLDTVIETDKVSVAQNGSGTSPIQSMSRFDLVEAVFRFDGTIVMERGLKAKRVRYLFKAKCLVVPDIRCPDAKSR